MADILGLGRFMDGIVCHFLKDEVGCGNAEEIGFGLDGSFLFVGEADGEAFGFVHGV